MHTNVGFTATLSNNLVIYLKFIFQIKNWFIEQSLFIDYSSRKVLNPLFFGPPCGPLVHPCEEQLLAEMKQFAVRAQKPLMNRVMLLNMIQAKQEVIRAFTERLKGQANTCTMSTDSINCTCTRSFFTNPSSFNSCIPAMTT